MKWDFDSFREIGDALVRNKSRSLLTGFGVFWGLFMLLFMVGGGDGVKQLLLQNFEGFASNTTIVYTSRTTKPYKGNKEGRWFEMGSRDVTRLKQMVPELEVVTPSLGWWGINAEYDSHTLEINVTGVLPEYVNIEIPKLKYGRFLSQNDCNQQRKVCIIGKRVYETLFPDGGNPCGTSIKVGGTYFTVVGVNTSSSNLSIQGSPDTKVYVPLPVLQRLRHTGDYIDLVACTAKGSIKTSTLEDRIRQVIARQHIVDPTDRDAIQVLNTEQIFQLMDSLLRGVSFLIWLVGLGTIFAGAIGVSNIMMVTVKERTTEIGIRRAIGATPFEILSQIIMESVSLTVAAGAFGIVLAVSVLRLMEMATREQGISFQVSFGTAMLALSLLALLGVAAGMAPAYRAMKIKPVDAMRDE